MSIFRKWWSRRKENARLNALRNLSAEDVTYNAETHEIIIKTKSIEISLTLAAIANVDEKSVTISGSSAVLDNAIVKSIWKVLWNEPISEGEGSPTFGECEVIADPNYIKITKKEIIVIDD